MFAVLRCCALLEPDVVSNAYNKYDVYSKMHLTHIYHKPIIVVEHSDTTGFLRKHRN